MEGLSGLFGTKGIEYLLVLGYLVAFIGFWRLLEKAPRTERASPRGARAAAPRWFHLPEGVFSHQGHTWARPEGADLVSVGMDDFAQRLLGRASVLELPQVGARIEQGERAWRLEFGSASVDLLAPVAGEVVAVNEAALRSPDLVNRDPYGAGWLLKVRVPRFHANLTNLLAGELAQAWMAQTVRALQAKAARDLGPVLQDGGLPVTGIARNLSAENWEQLARELLLTASTSPRGRIVPARPAPAAPGAHWPAEMP